MASGDIKRAANAISNKFGHFSVKLEQLQVVSSILNGRNVFAVLPTGYGKSFCYSCLPYMFDTISPIEKPSIVIVVAPLTAIMKDQVQLCS